MSEHRILEYFCPITGKTATPEDKDPPKGKELTLIHLDHALSKLIPSSSISNCNAEVTKVLKQAKINGLLLKIVLRN